MTTFAYKLTLTVSLWVLAACVLYVWKTKDVTVVDHQPLTGHSAFGLEGGLPLRVIASESMEKEPILITSSGVVTWYGIWKVPGVKYDGQGTASGVIFRQSQITFAAPVEMRNGKAVRLKDKRYKPVVPFGTIIKVSVGNRSITGPVTDTCIGGTWDTSSAGIKALGFKKLNQRIKGAWVEVVK